MTDYRARLNELKQLPFGWHDGQGLPPTQKALSKAEQLLFENLSAKKIRIFPSVAGGIVMDYEEDGWDYTIEVSPSGTAELFENRSPRV